MATVAISDALGLGAARALMVDYSYLQPATGRPFATLLEGTHNNLLMLDAFAGRYVLICCLGSSFHEDGRVALLAMQGHRALFDDVNASFLGVTVDPKDTIPARPSQGLHFYYDRDGAFSVQCGAAPLERMPVGSNYAMTWTIVDPFGHIHSHHRTGANSEAIEAVFDRLEALRQAANMARYERPAPILILPNVFDDALCDSLMASYDASTPRDSGFMRDNVEIFNHDFKSRHDHFVTDEATTAILKKRIATCVIPEIRKLFFIDITRMERLLVGCYAADAKGHFNAHRDNGQTLTAHRRFAVSVALNDDFEGGALVFPEYSKRAHRIPRGWALVFPCAILHAVGIVTKGRRYAFLPFLHDEAGHAIQTRNAAA